MSKKGYPIRDVLPGSMKVQTIMGHTTYACRSCGLAYSKFSQAKACCRKKNTFNAARERFNAEMSRLKGVFDAKE